MLKRPALAVVESARIRTYLASKRSRKKNDRFQEIGDPLIWKMPGFDLSPDEVDGFMNKARTHKTLILDLRGNGGGYGDSLQRMIGDLFDRDVKVGDVQERKNIKPMIAKTRGEGGKSLERVGVTPDEIKLPTGADLTAKSDRVWLMQQS